MIDHVSIEVRDLAASVAFYRAILAPLGITQLVDEPHRAGFGARYPELWLNARPNMAAVPKPWRRVAPTTVCRARARRRW
jgi:catechol 2,3-dioxygenase-like lactoylglutathione lyase family enzyme